MDPLAGVQAVKAEGGFDDIFDHQAEAEDLVRHLEHKTKQELKETGKRSCMSFIHARSSFSFSQDVIAFRISAKISTERLLVFNNTDSTVAFMTLLF